MNLKITYILIRFGVAPNQGLTLSGKNGTVYGHMVYDPKYNGHVLRMPQAAWEGGADENILKRTNRAAAVIRVRVEVEADAESREGLLEQELDFQKTRVLELESEVSRVLRERDAISADLTTIKGMMSTPAPAEPSEEPPMRSGWMFDSIAAGAEELKAEELKAAINAHGASTAKETAAPGNEPSASDSETKPADSETPAVSPSGGHAAERPSGDRDSGEPPSEEQVRQEAFDVHKTRLATMGHPAMVAEAKHLNATANAGIDANIKTKVGIRSALEAWYEKNPL